MDQGSPKESGTSNKLIPGAIGILLLLAIINQYEFYILNTKLNSLSPSSKLQSATQNLPPKLPTGTAINPTIQIYNTSNFSILAPKGGETLKLGQQFTIRWSAPTDMRSVRLIIGENGGQYYNIGTFPANQGSYDWQIGKVYNQINIYTNPDTTTPRILPAGTAYEIRMTGVYNQTEMNIGTDKLFEIIN